MMFSLLHCIHYMKTFSLQLYFDGFICILIVFFIIISSFVHTCWWYTTLGCNLAKLNYINMKMVVCKTITVLSSWLINMYVVVLRILYTVIQSSMVETYIDKTYQEHTPHSHVQLALRKLFLKQFYALRRLLHKSGDCLTSLEILML